MESVASAWTFLITFAGGAGVTWILRWFWWRVNAWTEFSAMFTSGIIATGLKWYYPDLPFSWSLIVCVFGAMCVWVPITFLTSPVDENQLVEFVRRVRPGVWGWRWIHEKYEIEHSPYLKQALTGWIWAVFALFSFNFMIGSLLLGHWQLALILGGGCLIGVLFGASTWKSLIKQE